MKTAARETPWPLNANAIAFYLIRLVKQSKRSMVHCAESNLAITDIALCLPVQFLASALR